jgi:hypothetical protein
VKGGDLCRKDRREWSRRRKSGRGGEMWFIVNRDGIPDITNANSSLLFARHLARSSLVRGGGCGRRSGFRGRLSGG